MEKGLLRVIPPNVVHLQSAQLLISCVEEGHEEFRTNLKRQPEPIKETSRELFLLLLHVESVGGVEGGGEGRWSNCVMEWVYCICRSQNKQ